MVPMNPPAPAVKSAMLVKVTASTNSSQLVNLDEDEGNNCSNDDHSQTNVESGEIRDWIGMIQVVGSCKWSRDR